MRTNKFNSILISGLIVFLLVISSCKKIDEFGEMNQNPNSPTTPVTSGLLTSTLAGLNSYEWDGGGLVTVSGLYCQYNSETQYTEASTYAKPTFNWDGYYAGPLERLQNIINYNSDPATASLAAGTGLANGSNNNQIAVARILKAYIFWFLTDSWGDIPYFNALKGDNGIVTYDSQESIYTDLLKELTEAVGQFDDGPPFAGDILFNGDITMWQKFANSARLLMALRLSKVNPTLGKTEFNAALSAPGGVVGEGENIALSYPGGVFQNPFYNYYIVVQRRDYAVTDVLINYLQNTNDDRAYVVGTSTTGFAYGLSRDAAIAFSNVHPGWAEVMGSSNSIFADGTDFNAETSPLYLLTSSEVFLARAEAAYLGWTSENIATMYYTGIAENWKQWDVYAGTLLSGGQVNGDHYNNYIAEPEVALTGTASDLQKIATQEWICHYPNGWQGWADWRRTGYPALTPALASTTHKIPLRFPYGPNEYTLNPENVKAAAAQYSADSQLAPVWWDK